MESRTENFSNMPLVTWHILDRERAQEQKLELIDLGNGRTLLAINICNIPQGMSIADYIEFIQRTGIVVKDDYRQ